MPTEAMLGSPPNDDSHKAKGGCLWWKLLSTTKRCLVLAIVLLLLIILALIIFTIVQSKHADPPKHHECLTRDCIESAGMIADLMDTSADPCEDFYRFSCGGFFKRKIPDPSSSMWSVFSSLGYEAYIAAKNTLEEPGTRTGTEAASKMKANYKSCVRAMAVDKNITLADVIKNLNIDENMDLEDMAAALYSVHVQSLFTTSIKEATDYFVLLIEDPNPQSIYDESNEKSRVYKDILKVFLKKLDVFNHTQWADEIFAFEAKLNDLKNEVSPQGSIERTPKKMDEMFPPFNWTRFFHRLAENVDYEKENVDEFKVISNANNYLKKLFPFLKNTPKRTLYRFFLWRFLYANAINLGPTFRKLREPLKYFSSTSFYSQNGFQREEPWRTCVKKSLKLFPEALTAEYAKRMLDENLYDELKGYLENIKENFKSRVPQYTWLDEETRDLMIKKVDNLSLVLAFPPEILKPEHLNDLYKHIKIDENDYLHNALYIGKAKVKDDLSRIGTVDQAKEWDYNPTEVNAFNYQYKNTIILPISILYPPTFQKNRPKYLNYAGLGSNLAHEVGHSFDTGGVKVDFRDPDSGEFFSQEMEERFLERVQCIIDQYSNFTFHYGGTPIKLDGNLAVKDNLADQVGNRHSWQAYLKWEKEHGEEPKLPGLNFTTHQLFFIQVAQQDCEVYESPSVGMKVAQTDHSPGEYRSVGALVNLPDFAETFNCPKGSFMNPIHKCELWT